eukprot:2307697-Rhodomonas_salina.2
MLFDGLTLGCPCPRNGALRQRFCSSPIARWIPAIPPTARGSAWLLALLIAVVTVNARDPNQS